MPENKSKARVSPLRSDRPSNVVDQSRVVVLTLNSLGFVGFNEAPSQMLKEKQKERRKQFPLTLLHPFIHSQQMGWGRKGRGVCTKFIPDIIPLISAEMHQVRMLPITLNRIRSIIICLSVCIIVVPRSPNPGPGSHCTGCQCKHKMIM